MSVQSLIRALSVPFFVLSILGIFCAQNTFAATGNLQNSSGSNTNASTNIQSTQTGTLQSNTSNTGMTLTGTTQTNTQNTSTGHTNTGNTSTGISLPSNSGSTQTGSAQTGSVQTGSTNTGSEVQFPEIIPELQRWSYATLSGNILACQREVCRINLNFEQIFNNNYPKSDFLCEISFENILIKKCNPPQWTLTGASEFEIKLIHKTSNQEKTEHFQIEYPFPINQTGSSQTGTTSTGSTSSGASQTGGTQDPLDPIEANALSYSDSDGDDKIDTILLYFPEVLTGSYVSGSLLLYSNSGGLYHEKINTSSHKIHSVIASGSTLVVRIVPSDFQKKILTISSSTSSNLRLKNTKNLGFTTLSGASLKKLGLTTSFEKYTNIIHPPIEILPVEEYTGSLFPTIIPHLQRATDGYLSGNTLVCNRNSCRVNLTGENIFDTDFKKEDFECRVDFGSGNIFHSCNPPQYTIGPEKYFEITLIHKTKGKGIVKKFPIQFDIPVVEKDENPPVIIIEMDGKWKEYYEQVDEYHLKCYTDICRVNLTAENSYDPEGGKLKFLWLYDFKSARDYNRAKRSKDPGSVKFGRGTHDIWLRVVDASGNLSQVHYKVEVLGKQEKKKRKKKKKRTNNKLFLPEIVIQNPKYVRKTLGGVYVCESTRKTCSVNFTLTGTTRGLSYKWNINNKEIKKKNPRSQKFLPGIYTGNVEIYDKESSHLLWKKVFIIKVLQRKKVRKQAYFDINSFLGPTILIQNKKYLSWKQNGSLLCRSTRKTCSANFKIQKPIKALKYIWYFDGKKVISKNPRSHKFTLGRHNIRLQVAYRNTVIWEKSYPIQVIRYKKPKKIRPFRIPEIRIQNPKYLSKQNENLYICSSSKDYCSANFKLENTVRGYKYFWEMNGKNIKSKNPRSQKFTAGNHKIILSAKNANGKFVWKKEFFVQVYTKEKIDKTDNYDTINAQNYEERNKKPESTAHISFLSLLLGLMIFGRKNREIGT
ncbi:hypothetical protein CSB09_02180 [Candidatus Gracilibacteria bacterium]|nr:MAG: hypothetical protein CSB09_02180 [Candidatus Gracilibacteria bacterium]